MASFVNFSPEEVADLLQERGICEDTTDEFVKNRVSGAAFLKLTEADLKDLVPLIGVRTEVRDILAECKEGYSCGMKESSLLDQDTADICDANGSCSASSRDTTVENPNLTPVEGSSNWHLSFEVPNASSFSGSVQKAIDTGLVTSKARQEIVQTLRTLCLQHTRQLTSIQYTTVCQKLITKYPKLRDTVGSNGFGSWKSGLRNSFKNFRRDHPVDKSSTPARRSVLKDTTNEPPSKRRKIGQSDGLDEEAVEDENEYEKCVSELKAEWKKGAKTRSRAVVKSLMDKTRNMRRWWIEQDRPMTFDILDQGCAQDDLSGGYFSLK